LPLRIGLGFLRRPDRFGTVLSGLVAKLLDSSISYYSCASPKSGECFSFYRKQRRRMMKSGKLRASARFIVTSGDEWRFGPAAQRFCRCIQLSDLVRRCWASFGTKPRGGVWQRPYTAGMPTLRNVMSSTPVNVCADSYLSPQALDRAIRLRGTNVGSRHHAVCAGDVRGNCWPTRLQYFTVVMTFAQS